MFGPESIREFDIARLDRRHHFLVLLDVLLRQVIVERRVVEPQHAAAFVEQARKEHGEISVAASLGDGDAQFVTPKVDAVTMNGWRIVDGRIWYESGLGVSPAVLREIDPATGAEREVARLDVALEETGFSVTAQRDGVIVTPIGSEDTDVGTFRLMRRSAGE